MKFENYLQRAELISLQNFLKHGGETFIPTSNKKYSDRITEARRKAKNFSKPDCSVQALNYGFCKFSVGYREIASIVFLCRRAISGEQATECCLKAGGSKTENS